MSVDTLHKRDHDDDEDVNNNNLIFSAEYWLQFDEL
jgi:hypothetical protein